MNNLFDSYLDYVKDTEPPVIFHRWSLLTCMGAYLGRQFYFPFGEFNIAPTMYVMLMGDPGTRKSTAIKMAKKIISGAGYDTFAGDRTSKEKFLLDLEGAVDEDGKVLDKNAVMQNLFQDSGDLGAPKEVFVCADEFNQFVGHGNLEFISLLGSLWDWDDPIKPFTQRLKTSRSVTIYQPTISILGGNTHASFPEAFPPATIGQGFLSRLLLIYGESSGKKIAFPRRPDEEKRAKLIDHLQEMRLRVVGECTRTKQAEDMLTTIYNTYKPIDDARFTHYSTRRFSHLLKLCMLSAAANLRTELRAEDVLFANTLLAFAEHRMPQALGEFGKAKHADVTGRIIGILNNATKVMTSSDIWKHVHADLDNQQELLKLLLNLAAAGKIQWAQPKIGEGGYLIKKRQMKEKQLYVDFSLLREAQP